MCITAEMNEETGTWIQNANPKPIKCDTYLQNNSRNSSYAVICPGGAGIKADWS